MGRRVYEKNTEEFVWKYCFAEQESEQYRIAKEIGVGELRTNEYCQLLTPNQI